MDDVITTPPRFRRLAGMGALLGAGALAGGIAAGTLSASAASTGTATTPAATSQAPVDGPASVRQGETALTGADADKAKAAALAAVSGGTVFRVETDADGDAYEAHMTKADGSHVTVKFDKDFTVTAVQAGMGAGGHGGPRAAAPSAGATG